MGKIICLMPAGTQICHSLNGGSKTQVMGHCFTNTGLDWNNPNPGLVQSHFDYCNVVWGNCAKTLSDKLQRLQNRAVRVLTNTCYDADANQLLKELGWDNLETHRQKLKAEMVYKSLNGLAPNYLSSRFIQRSDVITAYNLRDSDGKLAIPLPRTNYYKNSFGYSGAVLWNSLPSAARQATSLTSFQRLLINYDTAFM